MSCIKIGLFYGTHFWQSVFLWKLARVRLGGIPGQVVVSFVVSSLVHPRFPSHPLPVNHRSFSPASVSSWLFVSCTS